MSDSLLKALKIFVVVGAVVIVLGTATLISLLVKRAGSDGAGTRSAGTPAASLVSVALPPGAEVIQMSIAGSQLYLLGRSPAEGQFIIVVDQTSGERKRLFHLTPEAP